MTTYNVILLAHYKEREANLKRIIDDLLGGTVIPQKIIVFIDNSDIQFEDERTIILRSSQPFLPIIRFALGAGMDTDYCFFLDDDLTVQPKTMEHLIQHAEKLPNKILGFEGSILGNTETPYSNDMPIKRGNHFQPFPVDILIRSYFVPIPLLMAGLYLRAIHPELPKTSLDDVFLCLGNKYLNQKENYVIPVTEETNLIELPDGGVGQERNGDHYINRNFVCRLLMNTFYEQGIFH